MNINKRLQRLETAGHHQPGVVLLISYVEPNGEETPVSGYKLTNGKKVVRLPDETDKELESRAVAAECCRNGRVAALEPISKIILPDNGRE